MSLWVKKLSQQISFNISTQTTKLLDSTSLDKQAPNKSSIYVEEILSRDEKGTFMASLGHVE